jgi:hypothetical protein
VPRSATLAVLRFYFWICKTQFGPAFALGRETTGGVGQGVGNPPPSKETVPAKAAVSLVEMAEQSPKNSKTASEILVFITSSCRALSTRREGIFFYFLSGWRFGWPRIYCDGNV